MALARLLAAGRFCHTVGMSQLRNALQVVPGPVQLARRLSAEPGWVPPAFMIGAAFVIVALDFLISSLVPAAWVKTIGLTTFFSWLALGVLATLRVAGRTVYALTRLGIMGFTRPRWWFELGRLNVIAFLFGLLSMMVLFFCG
jgi:hypothetical protein